MRAETIKHLKENIGSNLLAINLSNIVMDRSPQTRETKAKINLMGLNQNKNLFHSKGSHQQNEIIIYWTGEYICKWYISNKGLISKRYKNLYKTKKKNMIKMVRGPE